MCLLECEAANQLCSVHSTNFCQDSVNSFLSYMFYCSKMNNTICVSNEMCAFEINNVIL